jgi:hypothetical protein
MRMPPPTITVSEIAKIVGDQPIEVMDVNSQHSLPDWTLFQWVHYFSYPDERNQILNVISFEISSTPLMDLISRPRIVRELDLVDRVGYPGPPNNE